jgi:uncharacterized membrane protein
VTLGLRRRSVGGAPLALASGALLYQGLRGRVSVAGPREAGARAEPLEGERVITVGRPAEELFRLWREPQNLSRILGNVADVFADGDHVHWMLRGPVGRSLGGDLRIVEERPGELLRWESTEEAVVPFQGSVRFRPAPGEWGTEVLLRLDVQPPGGALAQAAVKRLEVLPRKVLDRALRRFKSLAETGEIPTLEKNPSARAGAGTD